MWDLITYHEERQNIQSTSNMNWSYKTNYEAIHNNAMYCYVHLHLKAVAELYKNINKLKVHVHVYKNRSTQTKHVTKHMQQYVLINRN